ncbi:MAG: hypothetical protein DYG83_08740 [Candidatus Brocadia sp. AMX2]|uniref:Uncharacterized conserved protein n=1 Tax=Candidatus Brocadia sinica JPN1 TaxID=1197129 RepID=A0ABQ0K125_9BACT|nr:MULTISPECIES: hypothetical protein [Brocadia]MBC6933413.1 hypothetical protein [Candidatus Brocadia sp.]MBL1167984.1 hypothetical protein [Candidatus Brocadia sp. AMX1]NOG42562.1 hypothetical protein [Planctomycetota bacterium]GIK11792.1 MAG: hypothetical protein BroJett002_04990 [Candidatus Brocadia sinica]KAA0243019.1 MAG: hypothetical protein EDM70_11885 [Candidatus Brocadia sp. AMX2]
MQLKSIGYIKSPIKQPKFGGWQDSITEIVIDTNYADGLEGIDDYSHLIILYWLDKVDKGRVKHWRSSYRLKLVFPVSLRFL